MGKKKKLADEEVYERQAEVCSALSHPVRLQIIDLLQDEEDMTCSDMLDYLPIPKANLSQHLAKLKKARLVGVRREGLFQHYFLLIPEIKTACGLVRQVLVIQAESQSQNQKLFSKSLKRSLK